ncbi:MAG TPA: urea ABC transporter ATP-binding subunit UrtE [Chthoniobacterales bacterium]|nr:urea ABC transporter ATP-binding subunit UrtE [Chthoniobacterales bacterium]
MTQSILSIDKLSVAIGGSRILRDVSLELCANHVFCLMGRNGVGKTTALKSVVGLYKPHSGRIVFEGRDISRMPPEKRALAGIGYVPQGRGIFPHLTVAENLFIGAVAKRKKAKELLERVYSLFPIIKEFLPRKGGMLSGGQQQQLAIGRALLTEPKLLILDEPTEGIQPNIIDQIGEAIKLLRKESMTILLVEQYLEFCKELADNFAILDRGSVVAQGPVAELTDEVVKQHLTV